MDFFLRGWPTDSPEQGKVCVTWVALDRDWSPKNVRDACFVLSVVHCHHLRTSLGRTGGYRTNRTV